MARGFGDEDERVGDMLSPLFGETAMAAIFSDEARIAAMLDFEVALARAEARLGLVPAASADAIAAAADPVLFDPARIGRETALSGNPAIPLVKHLQAGVDRAARDHVHLGATSQDVIDTAAMLQARQGLDLAIDTATALGETFAILAERHRDTLQIGRTLLQHAVPISFGLKLAGWLAMVQRVRAGLIRVRNESLAVQFGGAAGTLAALGSDGLAVAAELAAILDLPLPALPWHTDRTRIAEIASALGVAAGAVAKIAADLVLLMSTDLAEVFEPGAPGKGGSSAMPHKRNPVLLVGARAAAAEALATLPAVMASMVHEQERAAGAWHAEWRSLPRLFVSAHGALASLAAVVEGLEVDAARMRANLEATRGLVMAESLTARLAEAIGKVEARRLVEAAVERAITDDLHLDEAAADTPGILDHLGEDELADALDPANYLGAARDFVDRALAAWDEARDRG